MYYSTDNVNWETTVPMHTNADTCKVYFKAAGSGVVQTPVDSVIAIINKAQPKITSAPTAINGLIYTGAAQTLINAGTATGGTILYRLKDGEFAQALPQGTLAGNYTVHYKVVGDENHYDFMPDPDSLVARVNKASLAIRGDNKAIKYGDPEPAEYTASCTGWVNGEDQSVLHGTLTVTCGYHQWNNAGSYDIQPYGAEATNYNDVGSDSLMVTIAEPDEPTALAPVQAPVSHVQKIIRLDQLNYIILPAEGYRNCSGQLSGIGVVGSYWSSTKQDAESAWRIGFEPGKIRHITKISVTNHLQCYGRSIRLVK